VPAVVAAPPGIVTLKDLPPITGRARPQSPKARLLYTNTE
jgi:hypothetical protein